MAAISSTALLEALPVAVYTTDADGRLTFYNTAAAQLWGWRPELGSARWCGSWRLFWPDGRRMPHEECPMALALKEGRVVGQIEAVAERPDGSRMPFVPYATPLKDESGRVIGAINLLVDVSDRKRADTERALLAAIVESSDDAIISKTLDGVVMSWNAGAERIFGFTAGEMTGQSITRIIPPDLHAEEATILSKLRRGERIRHYETVRVAKDGRRVDISLTVSPVRDGSGRIVGASKVARDVTERKQAENLRRLLVEELNHRVKNTLATVQAVASQSLRLARTPRDFVSGFIGRVQALARAHTLLAETRFEGSDLADIVRQQVLLDGGDDKRICCSGPKLVLDAQTSVHLAMLLYELATNARKYGALSVPGGRLAVSWEMATNGERKLMLDWKERGGPQVNAPERRGFGTTLIERTMRARGGEAGLRYGAEGVTCTIELPLADEARTEGETRTVSTRSGASVSRAEADRSLEHKRILVVEDEPLVSMDLEETLRAAGCHVVGPAGTLDVAQRLISETPLDAALLDVNLAGCPIDELAAALTQKRIPFAFVTGYGRDALPRGFRRAAMLGKPFSRQQLLELAKSLLEPPRTHPGIVQLRPGAPDPLPQSG